MARKSGLIRFKFWTLLSTLASFLSICMIALGYYFYLFIYKTPLNIPKDSSGYVFNITPGMQPQKMADILQKEGLIDRPEFLVIWIRVTNVRTKLKAGEYLVKPGMTPKTLIDLLISGKVIQHSLTLVEGWNFDSVMEAINQAEKLKHTLVGLSSEEIMIKLGYANEHPEGRFFPDTYCFPAGTTDVAFLQRAYNRMQKKLGEAWTNRQPTALIKTPYEALILASIIEKESGHVDEYTEISGVYHRRLERNMPLQADPTVIYGAGKFYTGKLTLTLLKTPNPYNTYINAGLPPTPIAMPSEKALHAATHPSDGETLYFVAKGEGKGHVFSKDLTQHNVAVSKYRKMMNQIQAAKQAAVEGSVAVKASVPVSNAAALQAVNTESSTVTTGIVGSIGLPDTIGTVSLITLMNVQSCSFELIPLPIPALKHGFSVQGVCIQGLLPTPTISRD